jgi:hypothetical protein
MRNAELAMTVVGTGLEAYLCLLLFTRKLYRQFGFFSLYTALLATAGVALIVTRNMPSIYFDVYWSGEALSVVIAFLALQESFYLVFRNFLSIPGFELLFPGIGILMLLVAIVRASSHPVSQASMLASTLISLEIGVGFLQFGIFCLFILLVRFFHMRWRQHAFGVVLGFGTSAAGSLVAYLLRSEFGTKFNPIVRIAPPVAYIVAVVVWLATFLRAEAVQPAPSGIQALTPAQMVSDLRRYTKAVKGILER